MKVIATICVPENLHIGFLSVIINEVIDSFFVLRAKKRPASLSYFRLNVRWRALVTSKGRLSFLCPTLISWPCSFLFLKSLNISFVAGEDSNSNCLLFMVCMYRKWMTISKKLWGDIIIFVFGQVSILDRKREPPLEVRSERWSTNRHPLSRRPRASNDIASKYLL